ncbi:DUF4214 domain-containing protein [Duganella sp. FT92W]|uniref:DUF4214 domain-containing protein n=1 Tax=Pseudoduganella rivuli TaxID=2666085 RepID=A0A7X2LQA3_9BURK|nr:Ig-like domain-containing protein [Pseudoduganella rivuli]MRV71130.1 DUF4214 domain-containing protein [Pseudoduganella rivuli]
MATVTQVTSITSSGLTYIDALLSNSPNWNYLTPASNTIYYTFSVAGNNESGNSDILSAPLAFSTSQQSATRTAMAYIAQLTGITFTETTNTSLAQVHFANANIDGAQVAGLCSSSYNYSYNQNNVVTAYEASAYIYMDNVEWGNENANLAAGGQGYETLLHELGHMLGLKHPFDDSPNLPTAVDTTAYTLMSYTQVGSHKSVFQEYDIAALKWLYGGDGLAGTLGVNSTSGARWLAGTSVVDTLTGTSANDTLEGDGGNDILNGGAGTDTAYYNGARSAYTMTQVNSTTWTVAGAEGTDTLTNMEMLRFTDGTISLSSLTADTTPPTAPTLTVGAGTSNARPVFSGTTEAGAKVEVFDGSTSLGTATANSSGAWTLTPSSLTDGTHTITAKATDAAGNTSAASTAKSVTVDTTPPVVPTLTVGTGVSSSRPVFSGVTEASAKVEVFDGSTSLGTATANSSGAWSLTPSDLAGGTHSITAKATDAAGNTSAASTAKSVSVVLADTTPPDAPTLNVSTGSATNRPLFSGIAEAGAKVEVFDGAGSLGTATAGANGAWSFTPDVLSNGSHSVTARASDAAGNTSAASAARSVTIASTLNLSGSTGGDTLTATSGNNYIDAGAGADTVAFSGNRANFTVKATSAGFSVTDTVGTGGIDQLVNVERLKFGDKMVGLDIDGVGGQAYRVYQAAFDRTPDLAGLGYWISQMDKGVSQRDVAASFVASKEFADLYGSNPTNLAYITKLYNNVLHRAPEQAGLDYWVGVMNSGGATRSEVLAFFSEGTENKELVIKTIANGFDYTPWVG